MAQTPTLTKCGAYLEQRAKFSSSLLTQQLHELLGPGFFQEDKEEALPEHSVEVVSQNREGNPSVPSVVWYTYGSYQGLSPTWTAMVLHPESKVLWYDTGLGLNSGLSGWCSCTRQKMCMSALTAGQCSRV